MQIQKQIGVLLTVAFNALWSTTVGVRCGVTATLVSTAHERREALGACLAEVRKKALLPTSRIAATALNALIGFREFILFAYAWGCRSGFDTSFGSKYACVFTGHS